MNVFSSWARLSRSALLHNRPVVNCVCTSRRAASSSASAATEPTTPVPPPAIYVSDSHDPFFNLAYEDWLFRKTDPRGIILYMYRNTPSVIIGRNQNPWKEINLHRLNDLGIPFVRRKSGGGTVYHDLGNTNYCVYVPRTSFERRTNAALVARALNGLDVPAFHVSGSAFKLVNARAYHHGTMLIEAKLGDLRGVLGTDKETMVTKGVASVSSPVRNLREWSKTLNHDSFVDAVSAEFAKTYDGPLTIKRITESELEHNDYVRDVVAELKSWDWMYGQTPEFTHVISGSFPFGQLGIAIASRHALITAAELTVAPNQADWWRTAQELVKKLPGERYGSLEGVHALVESLSGTKAKRMQELLDWLKREM